MHNDNNKEIKDQYLTTGTYINVKKINNNIKSMRIIAISSHRDRSKAMTIFKFLWKKK